MKINIFNKGIVMFLTTFPNMEFKEEVLKTYKMLLNDITDEQFKQAIVKICNNIREIYPNTNFVALVREQLKVDTKNNSIIAWYTAKKAVSEISLYRSVSFKNKVINSVIMAFGGWEQFNLLFKDEDDKWIQQRFERCYEAMAYRNNQIEHLPGRHERENTALGYTEKDSKMVKNMNEPILIESGDDIKQLTD